MKYPVQTLRVIILSSDCSTLAVGNVIHMQPSKTEENVIIVGVDDKKEGVEKYFKMYQVDFKMQTLMSWEIASHNCYDYDSVHPFLGKQNFHFYIPKAV